LKDAAHDPVVIPYAALGADVLKSIVESFVLREGTDYGEREVSHDQKVAHVMRQLRHGEAQIIFDPDSQTIGLVAVGIAPPRR
jgi:uncharacterized protein YheU (UPF0270 family)